MDDGTVARLGEQHWFMTTTTANAVAVYQHMQHCHQVLWPELDVQFTSVTEQWAQFAVAGPRSRELLQRVLVAAVALHRVRSIMVEREALSDWVGSIAQGAGSHGGTVR
jgi:sarcosine oxidase subunit alpha